jgi:predicted nuclease of predicted toxin-antitoxin system
VNFLLDHDVPERVGDVLRQEGHSVIRVREVLPTESEDSRVLEYATDHQLILVTCNRDDFLMLATGQMHTGIIILIRRNSRIAESTALLKLVRNATESGLTGNINFA